MQCRSQAFPYTSTSSSSAARFIGEHVTVDFEAGIYDNLPMDVSGPIKDYDGLTCRITGRSSPFRRRERWRPVPSPDGSDRSSGRRKRDFQATA